MIFQFRLTRWLFYLQTSILFWIIGWFASSPPSGNGRMFLFVFAALFLQALGERLLEYIAQKHYVKKWQPLLTEGPADLALKAAEKMLLVPANVASHWALVLIEVQSTASLLRSGRMAEAKRRLEWVKTTFAASLAENDILRLWVIGQELMTHLAGHGGEHFSPLLELFKETFAKTRLETQERQRVYLELFEDIQAVWDSPSEPDWTSFADRYAADPKFSIRWSALKVLEARKRKQEHAELVDPSNVEGDVLPLRRIPKGNSRIVSTMLMVLGILGGVFAMFNAWNVGMIPPLWIGLSLGVSFVCALVYTLRYRFHHGIAIWIYLLTTVVSLLF